MNVIKVDKWELFLLENFMYKEVLVKYFYLRGVYIDDDDDKRVLFVYIMLGVNDFVRICIGE